MSRIDDLIRDLCPDGVEYKPLGEVARYSPRKVSAEDLNSTTFVGVDNLVSQKGGRIDATRNPNTSTLTAYRPGNILLGNIRPYLKKIWLADRTGGCSGDVLAVEINDRYSKLLESRFLYYVLSSDSFFTFDQQNAKGAKMPRGDKKAILRYLVPVPPLEVQHEASRILDQFTQLEAELGTELEAELEARRLQFSHYRDMLLRQNVSHDKPIKLRDIGKIVTGKTPPAKKVDSWGDYMNFATPGDIRAGDTRITATSRQLSAAGVETLKNSLVPSGSILVTCIGTVGKAVENIGDCIPNQQINAIINDGSFSSRYLVHALSNMRTALQRKASQSGSTMPLINKSDFSLIEIHLPPLKEQYRIAEILDEFDTLTKDLTSSLSAEIEARRKQYEYYRDRLLTFSEKK